MNAETLAAIDRGELTAVTLDTSIFVQKNLDLEHGWLNRVDLLNDKVKFVLTDVVKREVGARLSSQIEKGHADLKRGLRIAKSTGALPEAVIDAMRTALAEHGTAPEIARERFEDWMQRCDCLEIRVSEFADIGHLMDRYFEAKAPFAVRETKKYEFPDAFALLALDAWAQQHKTKMLVVTTDGDWKRYCDGSSNLVAVEDLKDVLAIFPRGGESVFKQFIALVRNADTVGLASALLAELNSSDAITFEPIVHSQWIYDDDVVESHFERVDLELDEQGEYALDYLAYEEDQLVVTLIGEAHAHVSSHFSFRQRDSEGDDLPMGSAKIVTRQTVSFEAIVALEVTKTGQSMNIVHVEIQSKTVPLPLGEIRPDWMGEHPSESRGNTSS